MTHVADHLRTDTAELLRAEPQPRVARPTTRSLALSVLVPTRNEADNVDPLLARLDAALDGLAAEVIFVDDSDDSTPDVVRAASRARSATGTLAVSLLHRPPGARAGGLGGAVVAGL